MAQVQDLQIKAMSDAKRVAVTAGFDFHHMEDEAAEILDLVKDDSTLIGGAAVVLYVGKQARTVSPDLDVIANQAGFNKIKSRLLLFGFRQKPNVFGASFDHPVTESLSVDVLLARTPLDKYAVSHPIKMRGMRVIPAPALFMMKCMAQRSTDDKDDLRDARLLLKKFPSMPDDIESLRHLVSPADYEEIEATLLEFQLMR